ncbi:MAG: hypothetical protein ACRDLQ_02570 [Solirubrobacterales bacterium]
MSFAGDHPAQDMARQVGHALEDEAAQPLSEVQRAAPEGCDYFSELEASISEWSFGYGVAWALARMRDPLLGSAATGKIAEHAVRDAWRSFSGESWTALMGEDRARRGPVEGDVPVPPLAPAPPTGARPPAAAATAEPEEPSPYGDFMGKVARTRPRRSPPQDA